MEEDSIHLSLIEKPLTGTVNPGGSKSISNRLLIMEKLSGKKFSLTNLSKANDTVLLQKLLDSNEEVLDCEDAGTTFRFLTAYFALSGEYRTLTGSKRMQQRPISSLVDALNDLGANIRYKEKEGFPPLVFNKGKDNWKKEVTISADTSSQFISALILIAPYLKEGLIINLTGEIVSGSYIQMTRKLMQQAGIELSASNNSITIKSGSYNITNYSIESDWSSASYFYGLAAVMPNSEIHITGLQDNSTQGDSIIANWMEELGVETIFTKDAAIIKSQEINYPKELSYDFINCPDLFQTISVVLAAKGITGHYKGLSTLALKETDRFQAIKKELNKINVQINTHSKNEHQQTGEAEVNNVVFDTYRDHRMAMALSIFSAIGSITINDPDVVKKSFPNFWNELKDLFNK